MRGTCWQPPAPACPDQLLLPTRAMAVPAFVPSGRPQTDPSAHCAVPSPLPSACHSSQAPSALFRAHISVVFTISGHNNNGAGLCGPPSRPLSEPHCPRLSLPVAVSLLLAAAQCPALFAPSHSCSFGFLLHLLLTKAPPCGANCSSPMFPHPGFFYSANTAWHANQAVTCSALLACKRTLQHATPTSHRELAHHLH